MTFGSAQDVSLYRSAADVLSLATGDKFQFPAEHKFDKIGLYSGYVWEIGTEAVTMRFSIQDDVTRYFRWYGRHNTTDTKVMELSVPAGNLWLSGRGIIGGTPTYDGGGALRIRATDGKHLEFTDSHPRIMTAWDEFYFMVNIDNVPAGAGFFKWMRKTNDPATAVTLMTLDKDSNLTVGGNIMPDDAGVSNIGDATYYWNDISYKTLTDRGCPTFIEPKEALETLMRIKKHPTKVSVHKRRKSAVYEALPALDPETLPEWLRDIPTQEQIEKAKKDYEKARETWISCRAETPDGEFTEPEPQLSLPQEGLKFDLLCYTMMSAIQELKHENDELRTRVKILEGKR
jgi:hypothetical protein